MRFFILVALCFLFLPIHGTTQQDSLGQWSAKPDFKFSGFLESYYAYDFNKPNSTILQPYLFSHHRHNEFNLNIGLIQLDVAHPKYRGRLGLHTGTYAIDNYAAEPDLLKNIYEAYIGISLNKHNSLWLDAGIFSSHLGFESALSIDNWTLTRSLQAEHSPYYLSGVKLTYEPNQKWTFAATVNNGWQRIQRVQGSSYLSLGSQVVFHPSSKVKLNWSTFVGTDDPDETRRMRYFNNFFGQFSLSNRVHLIAGWDIGFQQKLRGQAAYNHWSSPIAIIKFEVNDQWATTFRAEYFKDENEIIVSTNGSGYKTSGFSWNIDYFPTQSIAWRIEIRSFDSSARIYDHRLGFSTRRTFITTSFALRMNN